MSLQVLVPAISHNLITVPHRHIWASETGRGHFLESTTSLETCPKGNESTQRQLAHNTRTYSSFLTAFLSTFSESLGRREYAQPLGLILLSGRTHILAILPAYLGYQINKHLGRHNKDA